MNNKKTEPKYFYGIVNIPYGTTLPDGLLNGRYENYGTDCRLIGHEFSYIHSYYRYSTKKSGLFGRSTRKVKQRIVQHVHIPIIIEKQGNCYIDVISGDVYRIPALPGQIEFRTERAVDVIWLSNYLKEMTRNEVENYVRFMNRLKKVIADDYQRRHIEEIKRQNEYNEADNYINEFRKKYKK